MSPIHEYPPTMRVSRLQDAIRSMIWQAFAVGKAMRVTPERVLHLRFVERERHWRQRRLFPDSIGFSGKFQPIDMVDVMLWQTMRLSVVSTQEIKDRAALNR
jgi:hypothetical protein